MSGAQQLLDAVPAKKQNKMSRPLPSEYSVAPTSRQQVSAAPLTASEQSRVATPVELVEPAASSASSAAAFSAPATLRECARVFNDLCSRADPGCLDARAQCLAQLEHLHSSRAFDQSSLSDALIDLDAAGVRLRRETPFEATSRALTREVCKQQRRISLDADTVIARLRDELKVSGMNARELRTMRIALPTAHDDDVDTFHLDSSDGSDSDSCFDGDEIARDGCNAPRATSSLATFSLAPSAATSRRQTPRGGIAPSSAANSRPASRLPTPRGGGGGSATGSNVAAGIATHASLAAPAPRGSALGHNNDDIAKNIATLNGDHIANVATLDIANIATLDCDHIADVCDIAGDTNTDSQAKAQLHAEARRLLDARTDTQRAEHDAIIAAHANQLPRVGEAPRPHERVIAPDDASMPFFVDFLSRQYSTLPLGAVVEFTETVQFADEDAANKWGAPKQRKVMLVLSNGDGPSKGKGGPGGREQRVNCPMLVRAQREAAARAGDDSAVAMPTKRQRVVGVRTFQHCGRAISLTDDVAFTYGSFPLMPNQTAAEHCVTRLQRDRFPENDWRRKMFRLVSYDGPLRIVDMSEFERVSNKLAASRFAGAASGGAAPAHAQHNAGRHANLWTERSFTSNEERKQLADEILVEILASKRVLCHTMPPPGEATTAFVQLATSIIADYPSATPERREEMQRMLLAVVHMHCRRLGAPTTEAVRNTHIMRQLDPAGPRVCEETRSTEQRNADAPPRVLSAHDYQVKQVKRAFSQILVDSKCGRAHATLKRQQAEHIPEKDQIDTLKKLHPEDKSYDPAAGVDMAGRSDFTYTIEDVPVEFLLRQARNMSGASPGPCGWTGQMLDACLQNPLFARGFQHFMVDVLNAEISDSMAKLLTASLLIGIPKGLKAKDGTRPLALGATFLKLASAVAAKKAEPRTRQRFEGSQYGMKAEGGSDTIIHHTRHFVRTGYRRSGEHCGESRLLATLDATNAFNTVFRQKMWDALVEIPELHGLFAVSYGAPSLLLLQHYKELKQLESKCGSRQGDVLGTLLFCLTIQRVVNALNAIEGVEAFAYIDDITLLCKDVKALRAAVAVAEREFGLLGMTLNFKKCEVMACDEKTASTLERAAKSVPGPLADFQVRKCVKLLGASIARTNELEREHLNERIVVDSIFNSLRMSASPQFLRLAQLCVLPKLNHALRVHDEEVTQDICAKFDTCMMELMAFWANTDVLDKQAQLTVQLPRSMGGLGLTSMRLIAPCAHRASRDAVMRRGERHSSQSKLTEVMYANLRKEHVDSNPELCRQLAYNALPGALDALSNAALAVHGDVFSAALRFFLGVPSATFDRAFPRGAKIPCPGRCKAHDFDSYRAWAHHVAGCVSIPGGLVTRKHNSMCNAIRYDATHAGWQAETSPPLDMKVHECGCGHTCNAAAWAAHRDVQLCQHARGQKPYTHGPDVRCSPPHLPVGMRQAYDVTVFDGMCASHANSTIAEVVHQKEEHKNKLYAAMCRASNCDFVPLVASNNGHLSRTFTALLDKISDRRGIDRAKLRLKLSSLSLFGTASVLLHAETLAGVRPPSRHCADLLLARHFKFDPSAPMPDGSASVPRASMESAHKESEVAALRAAQQKSDFIVHLHRALPQLAEAILSQIRAERERKSAERARSERDAAEHNVRAQTATAAHFSGPDGALPAVPPPIIRLNAERQAFVAGIDKVVLRDAALAAAAHEEEESRRRLADQKDAQMRSFEASKEAFVRDQQQQDVDCANMVRALAAQRDEAVVAATWSRARSKSMAEETEKTKKLAAETDAHRQSLLKQAAERSRARESLARTAKLEHERAVSAAGIAAANVQKQAEHLKEAQQLTKAATRRLISTESRHSVVAGSRDVHSYSGAHVDCVRQQQQQAAAEAEALRQQQAAAEAETRRQQQHAAALHQQQQAAAYQQQQAAFYQQQQLHAAAMMHQQQQQHVVPRPQHRPPAQQHQQRVLTAEEKEDAVVEATFEAHRQQRQHEAELLNRGIEPSASSPVADIDEEEYDAAAAEYRLHQACDEREQLAMSHPDEHDGPASEPEEEDDDEVEATLREHAAHVQNEQDDMDDLVSHCDSSHQQQQLGSGMQTWGAATSEEPTHDGIFRGRSFCIDTGHPHFHSLVPMIRRNGGTVVHLDADKWAPDGGIFFVCASGERSSHAAKTLSAHRCAIFAEVTTRWLLESLRAGDCIGLPALREQQLHGVRSKWHPMADTCSEQSAWEAHRAAGRSNNNNTATNTNNDTRPEPTNFLGRLASFAAAASGTGGPSAAGTISSTTFESSLRSAVGHPPSSRVGSNDQRAETRSLSSSRSSPAPLPPASNGVSTLSKSGAASARSGSESTGRR